MITFNYDALWNKSKMFVERAMHARDVPDRLAYHLWASVSLELLAKSALAQIHPALIADPSETAESLFAACGRPVSVQVKTIPAKTVFLRIRRLVVEFDEKMRNDCMRLMERRNAELHSGEAPIADLDDRAWVPIFWKAAKILLDQQQKTFVDWVGEEESKRVVKILEDTAEVIRQSVLARVARRRSEFNVKYRAGSPERQYIELMSKVSDVPSHLRIIADEKKAVECPSCALRAWIYGTEIREHVADSYHDGDSEETWRQIDIVATDYSADGFICNQCNLTLEGTEEVSIAGLSTTFTEFHDREADYGDDYGND